MENIQNKMKELFGGSCYGYCLARLFTGKEDVKTLTQLFMEGWRLGYIDDDGYVSLPIQYMKILTNKAPKDVVKVSITSLSELPEGDWIVEYKKNPTDKASHFVVANSKKVIFDPSGDSQTVKVGKPFSYRKFVY